MNYYAQGGQAQGLKSLTQELPKYGRYGDDVVAHISSDEARMLKQMGGSGTINPTTGLPEFFLNKVVKAVVKPFQSVYNATLKNIPGVDQALVGLDKSVGNAIPGGWNTLAQTALAFTPLGLPAKVGLAALGGSGALSPSGKFNLQRAILSGAMAYGANQLTSGLSAAGGGAPGPEALGNMGGAGFANAAPAVTESLSAAAPQALGNAGGAGFTSAAAPSTFSNFMSQTGQNLASAGQGIKNLSGLGPEGLSGVGPAATNFAGPVTPRGLTALGVGTVGLSEMDSQQDLMNSQTDSNSDYNQQMAIIESNRKRSEDAMRANPYQYAEGGEVPGYFTGGIMGAIKAKIESDPSFLSKIQSQPQSSEGGGFLGAITRNPDFMARLQAVQADTPQERAFAAMRENPYQFASGGMPPRFLSGGGDGMSDSIKANISGKQEARLADGEFVIPADVVSHMGNGSSKAGAKQLYSMMDRVRRARTGNPKQGKQINPKKLMPA